MIETVLWQPPAKYYREQTIAKVQIKTLPYSFITNKRLADIIKTQFKQHNKYQSNN